MHINDRILTGHIYEEAEFLYTQSLQCSKEEFLGSAVLKRSFARSIEIIGEAAKKLSPEFKSLHPQVNWKAISGMRDKLIHDYFGVDYYLVWNIAIVKSKELIDFIDNLNLMLPPGEKLF
jgi:uncharacterized protein with HEPN domain